MEKSRKSGAYSVAKREAGSIRKPAQKGQLLRQRE